MTILLLSSMLLCLLRSLFNMRHRLILIAYNAFDLFSAFTQPYEYVYVPCINQYVYMSYSNVAAYIRLWPLYAFASVCMMTTVLFPLCDIQSQFAQTGETIFLKLEWANNNCRLVITQLNSWTNEKRPTIFYFLFALCVCVCVCASFIELFVIPLYSRFIAIHSKLSLVSKSLLFISLPFLFFFSFYLFRRFSRALFLSHAHTHTHTHIRADTHTNTSVCLFAVIWQDRRCSSTRCRTSLAKMTCEREKRPQRARDTIIAAIQ